MSESNKKQYGYEGGFKSLGAVEATNYIWSNVRSCIVKVVGSTNNLDLISFCGKKWLYDNYPKTNNKDEVTGINYTLVLETIAEECSAMDAYSESKIRGSGVWLHSETGGVVVNSNRCYLPGTNNETTRVGKNIYLKDSSIGIKQETTEATSEEIEELFSALKSFSFKNSSDLILLFGWMAASFLCGALDWRPHIYLTGRRGTGKSTMDEIFSNIFSSYAIHIDGSSSAAGIKQYIKKSSRPIIIDEFGLEDSTQSAKRRVEEVLKLLRSACSGAEVIMGTADQAGKTFSVNFMCMLSGTTPPAFNAADATRIPIIELTKVSNDSILPKLLIDQERLGKLGLGMFKRMISNYDTYMYNVELFKKIISESESHRAGQTFSTLLSGFVTMLEARKISEDEAREVFNSLNTVEHFEAQNQFDEADILELILSTQLNYSIEDYSNTSDEATTKHVKRNIINIIRDYVNGSNASGYVLEENGLRFIIDKDKPGHKGVLYISVKRNHVQLNKIFKGSRWENGAWTKQLRRIEDSLYHNKTIDGLQGKAVGISINIQDTDSISKPVEDPDAPF